MEEWKDIKGYEGVYQISSHRRVKSLNFRGTTKSKILKQVTDKRGAKRITLYKVKRATYQVHRLVAMHFLENPNNLPDINHKDENPSNNNVNNLEWCDKTYNNNYGTRNTRISNANKDRCITPVICLTTNEIFKSVKEASNKYNIHQSHICHCCKNQRKSAGKHPITGEKLKWAYHMPKE